MHTWTAQNGGAPTPAKWFRIASSADGTKLAACVLDGNIWLSSNSGVTWTEQNGGAPTAVQWYSIASSSDGTKLAALVQGGNIWLSSNSGATWTAQDGGAPTLTDWSGVASSADGTKLAACTSSGNIWLSSNSGATWTAQDGGAPTTGYWMGIVSSADGTKLAAIKHSGNQVTDNIWLSSDSGATWTSQNGAPQGPSSSWISITSSANGNKLAAGTVSGNIWLSSDSGVTWTEQNGGAPTSANWNALASSANGSKLAAAAFLGNIWLGSEPDVVDPSVGTGIITPSSVTTSQVVLSWDKATDNVSSQANLQYLAYYSTNSSLDSLVEIEANGIAVDTYTADIATKTVTGLSSEVTYYFNVIVKDESGNKAVYTKLTQATEAIVPFSGYSTPVVEKYYAVSKGDIGATGVAGGIKSATVVNENYLASSGDLVVCRQGSSVTLPANPAVGDWVKLILSPVTIITNISIVVHRNGSKINSSTSDVTLTHNTLAGCAEEFLAVYQDSTVGWCLSI